ncbi:MAG: AMP-binding protein [Acidobacteria bacterium]|nr:AMP-binding protein [Acidobacteriota bacterium]NIM60341.1 AMP-binding protein [Acidobacteriota bacterium]NIO60342.1 AMP-binding protein [Acidobacteriota bacterium]NIQ31397.1 AMP-binding protein [Acidobacteriota bacterium]NIQ86623.1 AMP-binding protein [Acidobacteriota bacterium]
MAGFYQSFEQAAEQNADRCAIEVQRPDSVDRVNYAELRSMAVAASAFLARRGAQPGQRWAILSENGTPWCAAYLAMSRLGLVAVPLDTNYSASQVAKLLADCGATGIVASEASYEIAREAVRDLPQVNLLLLDADRDGVARVDFAAPPDGKPAADPAGGDPALILYTSGTTHDPKGVVLTHDNLGAVCRSAQQAVGFASDDAVLSVLPLFHALAQVANLAMPLSMGARSVFIETINTGELLRALQEREITVFCCVPQFFYLIHERVLDKVSKSGRLVRSVFKFQLGLNGWLRDTFSLNLGPKLFRKVHRVMGPKMRILVTGGSRFEPAIGRDLYRLGFDILQAYGLTETTGGVSVLRRGDRHVASVGQPIDGVDVKILPVDNHAQDPPPADRLRGAAATAVGEIAVRGPVVTPGYYERVDANAEAFDDGWFRTGDLGYLDVDQRLYITGRAKEIIVTSSGKNIYPEEIEAHYLKAASIAELCVLGHARPGEPAAERLHAIVFPDFDELKRRKILNAREIVRWEIEDLSHGMPNHKRILSYTIVSEPLPRTTTRKLKRLEIERRFLAGEYEIASDAAPDRSPDDPQWLADPHVAEALDLIRAAVREPEAVRGAANLELDLGLDSMERVELLTEVEARFGVQIEEQTAHVLYTVRDLVEATRPEEGAAGDRARLEDAWPTILSRRDASDPDVSGFFRSRLSVWAMFAGLRLIHLVAWLFLGFRVRGLENLPEKGPYLICPNHQSYIDGFLLSAALPYRVQRDVFIVGSSEYFETRLMRGFARFIRLIPVDPDTNLLRAMRVGAQGLRDGRVLMLFPEGERSIDREIKRFKKGAAILSSNIEAPIVPIAIEGAYDVWPRTGSLRLSRLIPFVGRVWLTFGEPLAFDTAPAGAVPDYVERTAELRTRVVDLLETVRARS